MTAYSGFASVYDLFMDDIPYREWLCHVTEILKCEGICDGLVLELGCGTGTFTELMAEAGYDMIGIDNSEEMLAVAREKHAALRMEEDVAGTCEAAKMEHMEAEAAKMEHMGAETADILYLQQDMRAFELYGTVRAIVSVCDSMNYITTEADLREVFRLANNYLDPQGLFVFDLKTAYYFREVMGDAIFAENRDEGSFIWENAWYEDEQINEYDLTLFVRREHGLFARSSETHLQRAYELETIRRLLAEAGMEFVRACDAQTGAEVQPESERIYVVAREHGKTANRIERGTVCQIIL